MLVLGLGGKPGSGKTTAAEAIRACLPEETRIYSVSEIICEEMGVKREDVKDARVLQDYATKKRKIDAMHYCKKIVQALTRDAPQIAVIPNIRTMEEIAVVRFFGGSLIRYTCLDVDGSVLVTNDRDMNHPLETALDDFNWDFYITARCGESRLVGIQTMGLVHFLHERRLTS